MGSDRSLKVLDCLIVGGGPAGLTAAIYLVRFHLSVLLIDGGRSRTAMIPTTHNHAGFPGGIAGVELLARMREQARHYGARVERGDVLSLRKEPGPILIGTTTTGEVRAKTVLLATGVVNRRPKMPDEVHDKALASGLLRYCPICDGYEVTDRPVAVIGTGAPGLEEAEFMRNFTASVTLVAPDGAHDLDEGQRTRLAEGGVELLDGPCLDFALEVDRIQVILPDRIRAFASLYPALGTEIRSALAVDLGVEMSDEGCPIVDRHQRTSVTGVYAAGDVVLGLDQISSAMGQGGIAATTIRNDLSALSPLRR